MAAILSDGYLEQQFEKNREGWANPGRERTYVQYIPGHVKTIIAFASGVIFQGRPGALRPGSYSSRNLNKFVNFSIKFLCRNSLLR